MLLDFGIDDKPLHERALESGMQGEQLQAKQFMCNFCEDKLKLQGKWYKDIWILKMRLI